MRQGWILTSTGERLEVPDHLLDDEEIFWPFAMPKKTPGEKTAMLSRQDLYRRYETIPNDVYLFVQSRFTLDDVPKDVIDELLGLLGD